MKILHTLTMAFLAAGLAVAPAMAVEKAPAAKGKAAQSSKPAAGLSRDEFVKRGDAEFAAMDANKDGMVDEAEVTKFGQNTTLTRATAQNKALFAKLDADKNGAISATEFAALVPKNIRVNARPMINELDSNKDGKVSAAEFRAGRTAQFTKADSNKDGMISQEEAKAGRKAAPKK